MATRRPSGHYDGELVAIQIDDFIDVYGTTARRRYLVGLLRNELDYIVSQGWAYRAFVFGSLVNADKPEPGDIDVLLCISKPFGADFWRKATPGDDIQIKGCQLSPTFCPDATNPAMMRPCHDAAEMVRQFNESTESTKEDIKIFVAQCVEVSL